MMADVEQFHFRLVLLGSHGTGKTSILNKFLFKKFETKYKPTVEDLFSKDFDLGSIVLKVDFLDTSGSMQFPAMRRLSITTGSAFLIVYAVDDDTSYEVLKMCIAEIQEIRPDYQEIPIVFAGNKCDIPRERRKVIKEVVSNYVHYELPRLRAKVIECSCRDNINIDNLFRAYLSLAKVSLSTAVSLAPKARGSQAPPPPPPIPSRLDAQVESTSDISRRASSMKVVLGVRKSCDASIVPTMRSSLTPQHTNSSAYIKNNSTSSPVSTFSRPQTPTCAKPGRTTPSQQQQQQHQEESSSAIQQDKELNLETAIQNKLTVSQHKAKPRSRSLIWRPSRKTKTQPETSDCRVS